ncbi:hydroxyisourate hydrolase [Paenibacillus soyae]|uniref:5-hydroxyisourate hydrolase n=1 Tax=Paenibacillus soyae TaxID=2969249 RepID=A0A9X2S9T9_9BACL|nr:hydroxyisourate hydrolase [Paenibacillus soyae]MCR2805506.1 hydroxyisourate hydrolase [Paenibacillus soyae]
MGKVTTHVLDTALGQTAAGMAVVLYRLLPGGGEELIAASSTNEDGRLDRPLVEGDRFAEGLYEIRFFVGRYFEEKPGLAPSIWDVVPIAFRVKDASQHYHIPLLVAPGAYSTYRGS